MNTKKNNEIEVFGYIKFDGFDSGVIGLKELKEIIDSLDKSLKFILKKEFDSDDEIDLDEFDFNIRVKEGSLIIDLIVAAVIGVITTYGITAAKNLAKNDIGDKTTIDLYKVIKEKVYEMFYWFINIKKHLKGQKPEKEKFIKKNSVIELKNYSGEILPVPTQIYLEYKKVNIPENFLRGIFSQVKENNDFIFYNFRENNEIRISEAEKGFLISSIDDDELILPELKHGEEVELEGKITKINEKWKTLGFEYKGHILVLKPYNKSLLEFKDKLIADGDNILSKVRVKGVVSRLSSNGKIEEKKPKIIFSHIEKIEDRKGKEQSLFENI